MRSLPLALVATVAICASAFSQCSTLTVAGSINAGQTVTVDVTGAPADAMTFVVIGDAGTTTLPFGGGTTLGVASPFLPVPIGVADAAGHVALSVDIPASIPAGAIQDYTFTVQAVSLSFVTSPIPSFSLCVSNTASLVSGNG
jgi:hypothetical protein